MKLFSILDIFVEMFLNLTTVWRRLTPVNMQNRVSLLLLPSEYFVLSLDTPTQMCDYNFVCFVLSVCVCYLGYLLSFFQCNEGTTFSAFTFSYISCMLCTKDKYIFEKFLLF